MGKILHGGLLIPGDAVPFLWRRGKKGGKNGPIHPDMQRRGDLKIANSSLGGRGRGKEEKNLHNYISLLQRKGPLGRMSHLYSYKKGEGKKKGRF